MGNSNQNQDQTTIEKNGHCIEENSSTRIGNGLMPLCAESPIDNGTWLEMEHNTISSTIIQKNRKKTLVSLNVTPEDSEQECNLAPYHKNHSVQECLKDQYQTEGLK